MKDRFIALHSFIDGSIDVEKVEVDVREAEEEGVTTYELAMERCERNDASLLLLPEPTAKKVKEAIERLLNDDSESYIKIKTF